MSDSAERPLFADIRAELGALGVELRQMAALRWQLARLELQSDVRSVIRLAIGWLIAALAALTALPLAVVLLADALDGVAAIGRGGWLLIFAVALLTAALAGGYLAWRRFCRRFVGLRETLEELREDLIWLREMSGNGGT